MFRYTAIGVCLFCIISCKTTYRLSKDDLKWNPYHIGDLLVFKGNKESADTIFIRNISKGTAPNDNLASPKYYYEWLNVGVDYISSRTDAGEPIYTSPIILSLSASPVDSFCGISFEFISNKGKFYSDSSMYDRRYLEQLPIMTMSIDGHQYTDIIKIKTVNKEYLDRENFITTLYWSKQKGYVRFDLNNGEYYELVGGNVSK